MNRLRVCLVSAAYYPYPSGVSEHVHHLAIELQKLGHETRILTTNYPNQNENSLPVSRIGRALVLPANRSRLTLPVGLRLPSLVRRFLAAGRFDIVHCHGIFPPEIAYWAIRYSQAPVVVTFHTLGRQAPGFVRDTFTRLFPNLNRRVGARIAVSQAGRSWAEAWFPGRYHVIPNGVDLGRFRPDAAVPGVFKQLGPSILFLGRLEERKGLPVLLRAMPDVLAGFPGVRLVVVGSGPLEKNCRALADRLGLRDSVLFAGRIPSEGLPGYYAGSTVYASPALGGEAMGIVLIEALASGKPVVASRIAGYDEVIADGRHGLLVQPNDPAALAVALKRVLGSAELRQELSRNGLKRASEFAWPRVTREILSVYQEVLLRP